MVAVGLRWADVSSAQQTRAFYQLMTFTQRCRDNISTPLSCHSFAATVLCCRTTAHGPMLRRSVHNSWKSLSIDLSFLLLCRLTNNPKCHQFTLCHISHGNLCVLVCLLWVAINQSVFHHLKEGGLSENVKHFGGRTV